MGWERRRRRRKDEPAEHERYELCHLHPNKLLIQLLPRTEPTQREKEKEREAGRDRGKGNGKWWSPSPSRLPARNSQEPRSPIPARPGPHPGPTSCRQLAVRTNAHVAGELSTRERELGGEKGSGEEGGEAISPSSLPLSFFASSSSSAPLPAGVLPFLSPRVCSPPMRVTLESRDSDRRWARRWTPLNDTD